MTLKVLVGFIVIVSRTSTLDTVAELFTSVIKIETDLNCTLYMRQLYTLDTVTCETERDDDGRSIVTDELLLLLPFRTLSSHRKLDRVTTSILLRILELALAFELVLATYDFTSIDEGTLRTKVTFFNDTDILFK